MIALDKKWKCQFQNLHTHTTYSDGINTPEEMVLAAIEQGFSSLGFSEHSYIENIPEHWLMPDATPDYLAELDRLKEKYAGQIDIFKGIELDSYSNIDTSGFDYIIGNVHFCPMWDGVYMEYCHSPWYTAEKFMFYYDFNVLEFARDYFDRYVSYFENTKTHIDIAGHFDVVTKFAETHPALYNFESQKYRDIALDALHAVKKKCDLFEVNAGHMGRKQRSVPCPEPFLLKELKNIGGRVCVTTDAHATFFLDRCIDEVLELLLSCGFENVTILTKDGFVDQKII